MQELVIVLAFLGGLWTYAGIHPETEIFKAFTQLVPEISSIFFWIGVLMLTIIPILVAHLTGKLLGFLALLLALIGGIFVDTLAMWSFIAGLLMGLFAPFAASATEN